MKKKIVRRVEKVKGRAAPYVSSPMSFDEIEKFRLSRKYDVKTFAEEYLGISERHYYRMKDGTRNVQKHTWRIIELAKLALYFGKNPDPIIKEKSK